MTEIKNAAWLRHLDTIGDELLRLTAVCDVDLRQQGVVERIVKNDETVCGKRNPIGFRKLRELVIATIDSLNKSADRIGPDETATMVNAIMERLDRRRELAGIKRSTPGNKPG
ncbi:MAG TPA: hypothetical protein VFX89_05155 [Gammaproteobacteria bacterium]|nr:hypothetical protein [Gammaproteobacteria bacterium]